jgi:hypothetical protein
MPEEGTPAQAIERWFASARQASLLLPDGWFGGRPYESYHALTWAESRPHRTLVELDRQLLLVFSGAQLAVSTSERELTVGAFAQLTFDWLSYGTLEPHVDVYREGVVTFEAPPG